MVRTDTPGSHRIMTIRRLHDVEFPQGQLGRTGEITIRMAMLALERLPLA